MSNIDTLCKGTWKVSDDFGEYTRECPLRKNCLRSVAQRSVSMVPYFDVVPVRQFIEANPMVTNVRCEYFVRWNGR